MTQASPDSKAAWAAAFTGVSLKPPSPVGGGSDQALSKPVTPQLSLSPDVISDAFKMGAEDGAKKSSPKFRPGEGPLSDAYFQGYSGIVAKAPPSPPAGFDADESEWFNKGMADQVHHNPPQVVADPKKSQAYMKGYGDISLSVPPVPPPGSPPPSGTTDPSSTGKDGEARKDEEEGPEVATVADAVHKKPKDRKITTQVTYNIKLRAVDESSPPVIQVFPDAEISIAMDASGKAPELEAKINAVKVNLEKAIKQLVNLKGKIKIEATAGVSAKPEIDAAGTGQWISKIEKKISVELSISIPQVLTIKATSTVGLDGKPGGGVGLEVPLPKVLQ